MKFLGFGSSFDGVGGWVRISEFCKTIPASGVKVLTNISINFIAMRALSMLACKTIELQGCSLICNVAKDLNCRPECQPGAAFAFQVAPIITWAMLCQMNVFFKNIQNSRFSNCTAVGFYDPKAAQKHEEATKKSTIARFISPTNFILAASVAGYTALLHKYLLLQGSNVHDLCPRLDSFWEHSTI